jgi:hypothetical protein
MKHLLAIALSFIAVSMQAQLFSGDGYYRGHNMVTERYMYVYDNTGKINWTALDAEMGAIELWKEVDYHSRFSDPASVVYMEKHGSQYDFQCQGMGLYKMFNQYVTLQVGKKDGIDYYSFSVTKDGVKKSLYDGTKSVFSAEGYLRTTGSGDYSKWVIAKVDTDDEWFGINPSIEVNGKFFHPFYADFGFTPVSADMKVWYISVVDKEGAVLKEFTGDVVPANMPVFIECTSGDPKQNKLDLKYYKEPGPADNKLKGVYFNNIIRKGISVDAATEFDKSSMRVLGVTQDGRLGYILSKEKPVQGKQYLAANQSYLVVDADCPSEIPVITEAEYEEILANRSDAAVHVASYSTPKEVYSISGRFIGKMTADEIKKLSPGIYIIGRRKFTVE